MLSTFPTLLPFLLFAFVASITPGPTNILVLSNSARFGFRAALPIVFAACASAAVLVLLVGSGFGQTFDQYPVLHRAMQWIGALWLSYLSWQIYKAPAQVFDHLQPQRRLSIWGAAALQWVNPKTWMMAIAVVSVFAGNGNDHQIQVVVLSGIFFAVSLPCLTSWAILGSGTQRYFGSSKLQRRFNHFMALLLLASAWLSFY